jgi:F plasmid transfer operon, TraF, protein
MISPQPAGTVPCVKKRKGDSPRCIVVALLLLALGESTAAAQSFDVVGARALGMGGAFVAVADDASATWWNPAGLPNSLILDGVAEGGAGRLTKSDDRPISGQTGSEFTSGGVAFAFPVVGASYFRTRQSRLDPSTAGGPSGRQDEGTARVGRSLLLHQFGLSLAHSLGDAVVLGATVRVMRGELSTLIPAEGPLDEVFDALGEIDGSTEVQADLDLGVLVRLSRIRMGLATRNLTTPSFSALEGNAGWELERQARLGMAIVSDPDRAGRHDWVVAVDTDLRRENTPLGERRDLAVGGERWFKARRIGIRAGLSASTAGEARPAASGGASVAVASGFWVEAQVTRGGEDAERGWGVAAHVMF